MNADASVCKKLVEMELVCYVQLDRYPVVLKSHKINLRGCETINGVETTSPATQVYINYVDMCDLCFFCCEILDTLTASGLKQTSETWQGFL